MDNQPTSVGATSNIVLKDGTQLDPKVVKVMRAIRGVESGGDYNAVGDNGTSTGAYQFHGNNWKNWAGQYLKDSNAPMTPENQNKLMYARISQQKAAGLDPEEIAALHNGAHVDKSTGKYTYNAPEYGQKFRSELQGQSDNSGYGYVTPPKQKDDTQSGGTDTKPNEDTSLLSKIGHGIGDVYNSIASPFIGLAAAPVQALAKLTGQPDPYAQGVPSLAGTNTPVSKLGVEQKLGDAAQVGSYFVPGEGVLGAAGMGALQGAGSQASRGGDFASVATGAGTGALIGGATAGLVKGAGGLTKSFGGMVSGEGEQKAVQGIKDAYGSALNLNASERAFESRSGKDLAQVLMDNKVPLARNANGTLDASNAIEKLQSALEPLNQQAQQVLSNPQGVVRDVSLSDALEQVKSRIQKLSISQAEKNTAISHATDLIGAEAKQYGESVSPEIADQIKQGLWGSSFKGKLTSVDKLQGNVSYITGNTLKTEIEKAVAGTDAGNVLPKINQQRSDLVDAIKRLSNLDGTRLLKGGKLVNIASGAVGSISGMASGAGPLGVLAGDYFGQRAGEFLQNPATKIGIAGAKAKVSGILPKLLRSSAKPIGNTLTRAGGIIQKGARPVGLLTNLLTK
jgi:uncharacterized protein YoxC